MSTEALEAHPSAAGVAAVTAGSVATPLGSPPFPGARSGPSIVRLSLGWGVGTLGASLLLNGFAIIAPFFLTTVLGASAAMAGVVLLVAKIWDVFSNPLMGALSDATQTRWGRRRPYLLLGGVVAGTAYAGLFSAGVTPIGTSLWLVGLLVVAVGTGYTIFNVPYMAMPAEMIDDYAGRTRMFSYRVFFIAVGTVIGGSAGQKLAELAGGGRRGYAIMGIAVGLGVFVAMSAAAFGTAGARFTERTAGRASFVTQVKSGFSNRPFVTLLGVKFCQLFGLFTSTAMALFLIKFVIGQSKPGTWGLIFGIASMGANIIAIPLWLRIARRLEKRRAYIAATTLYSLNALTWLLANPAEPLWIFALRGIVFGVAAAGMLLMGQSMLSDVTEYDYRLTGLRREGVFSGLYSFVEKGAAAFGPAILLFVYQATGFQSKSEVQTPEAIDGIRYAAAFLPCLYFGLSIPLLFMYRLDEAKLKGTPQAPAVQY
jgi:GPH family glycoside/pentoside/hexuronide:cation symporter